MNSIKSKLVGQGPSGIAYSLICQKKFSTTQTPLTLIDGSPDYQTACNSPVFRKEKLSDASNSSNTLELGSPADETVKTKLYSILLDGARSAKK